MKQRIQSFDWSATDLGPMDSWPQCLKTAVDMVTGSPVPMALLWGADGIMIYNDAYARVAGTRHPKILGSPVLEAWPEVADFNRRVLEVVLAGETLSFKDKHFVLNRRGEPEDVWLNLDYSPVRDEAGEPVGVLADRRGDDAVGLCRARATGKRSRAFARLPTTSPSSPGWPTRRAPSSGTTSAGSTTRGRRSRR